MESTPPSRVPRQRHTPTPKMSERKKALFATKHHQLPATIDEDSDLGPMSPLQFSCSPSSTCDTTPNTPRRMRSASAAGTPATDFRNLMQKLSPGRRPVSDRYEALTPTTSRWPSPGKNRRQNQPTLSSSNAVTAAIAPVQTPEPTSDLEKENYTGPLAAAAADQQKTPTAVGGKNELLPRKSLRKSMIFDTSLTPTGEHMLTTSATSACSDEAVESSSRARASLSFAAKQAPGISARSFYGASSGAKPAAVQPPTVGRKSLSTTVKSPPTTTKPQPPPSSSHHRRSRGSGPFQPRLSSGGTKAHGASRGHRVTKPKAAAVKPTTTSATGTKLLNTAATATPHLTGGRKFTSRAEVVAAALALIESHAEVTRAIRDNSMVAAVEKHETVVAAEEHETQITQTQIDKLQRILGTQRNAYELSSKQLNWMGSGSSGSNQLETTVDMDNTFGHMSVLDATLNNTVTTAASAIVDEGATTTDPSDSKPAQKRKFFKSDKANVHQYTVMRGICASVKRGAVVTLLSPPKKKTRHSQAEYAELRAIQQEVTDIISMLEDTGPPQTDRTSSAAAPTPETVAPEDSAAPLIVLDETTALANYERFAAQLPYGSVDAETQQRQRTLLNLLYTHRICNDRTFRIFIVEPERHEAAASQILDQLFQLDVVGASQPQPPPLSQSSQPMPAMDVPVSPASQISTLTSAMELGSPGRQSPVQPRPMFPVFYKDRAVSGVDASTSTTLDSAAAAAQPRAIAWRAYGRDARQLQIDAGQRRFGGALCNECGMFYSRHEPEDEALHQRFHAQTVRLQFKGWQDERVVAEVPEWGSGGRIVCVTQADAKPKRTRVAEWLAAVDEQLGMAEETEVHERSVIYLAIARRQVVGLCVAEPLHSAHPLRLPDDDAATMPMIDLTSTRPVRCGLSRLWVCDAFRLNGIGRRLYGAVCEHFVRGGCRLRAADVAFGAPTEAGWRFAGRMVGGLDAVLVY